MRVFKSTVIPLPCRYVRRLIGQRVRLRRTPEVRFVYDDSEEEADLVERVIGREEVERYRSEIEVRAWVRKQPKKRNDKKYQ
jgi:hypothetical protein